jgi:hypothetical protein
MNVGGALILIAFVLALMEAFRVFPNPRVSWGWLGIALWFASLLIGFVRGL